MSRKLTKEELELLENLAKDDELMGKGFIRRFIIRNTYTPKYKVGDYVKVTDDTSSYICGKRIKGLNAVVTSINWLIGSAINKGDECIQYELDVLDQDGKTHFACAEESIYGKYEKRHIDGFSNTNVNHFNTSLSDGFTLSVEDCGL